MSLSSYNGHSNFTIKGKKFIKRGANNIYDIASVAGTSGNFSTGWVNSGVANRALLTFDHNLGTDDLIFELQVADNNSGLNATSILGHQSDDNNGNMLGAQVQETTSSTVKIRLGVAYQRLTSTAYTGSSFTGKFVKLTASAGGGAARASGTIVATNGNSSAAGYSASSWSLTSGALNVASMTQTYDAGSGRYGIHNAQFTITFSSPISKPIPIVTCENMGSYTIGGYTSTNYTHRQRVTFSNSNATTQSPLSNAFENQEFDTMLIYQGYNMPAWTSFVIF